jgi:hypothetical protein
MGKRIYPQLADPEWLREQYEVLGQSSRQIAAGLGARHPSVLQALKRHGIKRRASGKNRSGKRLTHGHARKGGQSPTYRTWRAMLQRCDYPSMNNWDWYGGRGITVCDRWRSFENFLADMGERPDGLTLDRKNPNGNYEPANCHWATWAEQMANRR